MGPWSTPENLYICPTPIRDPARIVTATLQAADFEQGNLPTGSYIGITLVIGIKIGQNKNLINIYEIKEHIDVSMFAYINVRFKLQMWNVNTKLTKPCESKYTYMYLYIYSS